MTNAEAREIVAFLNACYPKEAIEAETAYVWILDLALLPDVKVAQKAAKRIFHQGGWFPSMSDFRRTYRAIAESERISRPALESPPRANRRPEWVDVWTWGRQEGEERWFPQQREYSNRTRQQMDQTDYEGVAQGWEQAGRPRIVYPGLPA